MFYVELVWNREFNWSRYGGDGETTLEGAEALARILLNSGDGERVKKARVVDDEGNVVIPRVSY